MNECTRREALRVAAATGVAAISGTACADDKVVAAKAMQPREVPMYLKVPKNLSLRLKMPANAERLFKEGEYKPAAFKLDQKPLVGNKLEVTVPYGHGHGTLPKLTLTEADKINYILMKAERDATFRIEVFYSDVAMNLSRCCWQCDGMLYCALPGFCVECGPWTYCCPMDGH